MSFGECQMCARRHVEARHSKTSIILRRLILAIADQDVSANICGVLNNKSCT